MAAPSCRVHPPPPVDGPPRSDVRLHRREPITALPWILLVVTLDLAASSLGLPHRHPGRVPPHPADRDAHRRAPSRPGIGMGSEGSWSKLLILIPAYHAGSRFARKGAFAAAARRPRRRAGHRRVARPADLRRGPAHRAGLPARRPLRPAGRAGRTSWSPTTRQARLQRRGRGQPAPASAARARRHPRHRLRRPRLGRDGAAGPQQPDALGAQRDPRGLRRRPRRAAGDPRRRPHALARPHGAGLGPRRTWRQGEADPHASGRTTSSPAR